MSKQKTVIYALIGDMSFIDPRSRLKDNGNKLIIERDKLSSSSYLVKPGLTGLGGLN